jgi:hypothetical protein
MRKIAAEHFKDVSKIFPHRKVRNEAIKSEAIFFSEYDSNPNAQPNHRLGTTAVIDYTHGTLHCHQMAYGTLMWRGLLAECSR